ncbi:MAG: nucleoside kinase [Candidatus Wallacebacter cryptica]|nr:nucleoside kinase [Bacillota bacterium]
MDRTVSIRLPNGEVTVPRGTSLSELVKLQNVYGKVTAAYVDNQLRSLDWQLEQNCDVELLDLTTDDGMRVYRNSLVFVLCQAAKEVLPGCRVHIEHALSNGLYGEITAEQPLVESDVIKIEQRMMEIIMADKPFVKHVLPRHKAIEIFKKQGLKDKVKLLSQLPDENVVVHSIDDYYDTIADVFVPTTGLLLLFKLRFYLPGFILEFPKQSNPVVIPEYVEHGKLANVYYETEKWGKSVSISNVAELNDLIAAQEYGDLIRICEAYHEKQIAGIADQIAADRDRLRIVLIAGPSSSGKTTFAQRLLIQLRINRLQPVVIGLDDYFVNRDQTPRDENGDYDFEALEAIDIELFNEHLSKLIQGEAVNIPIYNFHKGEREWNNRVLQIGPDQPIIIEGIHGLNDKLTEAIPKGRKFKIYISAITQINIDDHTRIPTTDARLIRRIIRDHQFRSQPALDTIYRWPSVRRGEEKHIFPFQEDADVMFNSAMDYELAVLKKYAEPLLTAIGTDEAACPTAQRLLRLLSYFKPMPSEDGIPCNSILKEFLGGSCFDV